MKYSFLIPAVVLAITLNLHAQPAGFAVTQRGADYKVLQNTVSENGTNRVHQITELATGLHYLNNGQWQNHGMRL